MADNLASITIENNVSFKLLEDGRTEICMIADKSFRYQLYVIRDILKNAGDKLTLRFSKFRKKRSLDANNYFWKLCQLLAEEMSLSDKTKVTKLDVYRKYIKEVGQFTYVAVENRAVESYIRHWESRGDGFICEDLGESKVKGCRKLITYFGSSTYNSREFSVLLNAIIEDCKEQGIETLPPDEVKRLVEAWSGKS